jgi:hypothetical protein
MNDEPHSPAPGAPAADADELASAYLDGELAPEERVRAEADPAVMERVAAFRRVAEQVGAPVARLAETRREAMLHDALEAFDAGDAPPAGAPVIPLDTRRRSRRLVRVLAPVAAAAAAVGAVAFLARDDDGDDTAADAPAAISIAAESDTVELATVAEGTAAPAEGGAEAPAGVAEESAATEATAGAGAPTEGADAATPVAATETTAVATAMDAGAPVPALVAALESLPDLGAASTPAEVADLVAGVSRRTTEPDNAAAVHAALADCAGLAGVPIAGVAYREERTLLVPLDGATYAVVALDCRIVAEVTVAP